METSHPSPDAEATNGRIHMNTAQGLLLFPVSQEGTATTGNQILIGWIITGDPFIKEKSASKSHIFACGSDKCRLLKIQFKAL